MGGKVILIKTDNDYPKLIPATALKVDGESETVILDRPVGLDGEAPINAVPQARCFEFDSDLMEQVNALTEAAILKISAARQLCDAGLTPAEFLTDGEPGQLQLH
jgi:hypothetical protein